MEITIEHLKAADKLREEAKEYYLGTLESPEASDIKFKAVFGLDEDFLGSPLSVAVIGKFHDGDEVHEKRWRIRSRGDLHEVQKEVVHEIREWVIQLVARKIMKDSNGDEVLETVWRTLR